MNKNIFIKCFVIFYFLFFLFSIPVKASQMTDLGDVGGMFSFTNSDDATLADSSMDFTAENPEDKDATDFWNLIYGEYRGLIVGIAGVCFITFAALFIMNFVKLGATAGNPQARKACVINILWTGVATAASAGVTLFVGLFINILN